jgi:COQ9
MLTDYSPGFSDSWQQLDRRLEDIKRIGKASQQVRGCLGIAVYGSLCNGLTVLVS